MPYLKLNIRGRKTMKTGYLEPSRYSPSDFKAAYICNDFVVIETKSDLITVNEQIKEVASLHIDNVGPLVSYDEDGFICLKERTITLYDANCKPIRSRAITDDEYARAVAENPDYFS